MGKWGQPNAPSATVQKSAICENCHLILILLILAIFRYEKRISYSVGVLAVPQTHVLSFTIAGKAGGKSEENGYFMQCIHETKEVKTVTYTVLQNLFYYIGTLCVCDTVSYLSTVAWLFLLLNQETFFSLPLLYIQAKTQQMEVGRDKKGEACHRKKIGKRLAALNSRVEPQPLADSSLSLKVMWAIMQIKLALSLSFFSAFQRLIHLLEIPFAQVCVRISIPSKGEGGGRPYCTTPKPEKGSFSLLLCSALLVFQIPTVVVVVVAKRDG